MARVSRVHNRGEIWAQQEFDVKRSSTDNITPSDMLIGLYLFEDCTMNSLSRCIFSQISFNLFIRSPKLSGDTGNSQLSVCASKITLFEKPNVWTTLDETLGNWSPAIEVYTMKNQNKVTYVTIRSRRLVSSLLCTLCFVHHNGYVIEKLGMENLLFIDDNVKFWELELVQTSQKTKEDNYSMLADVIAQIVGKSGLTCPYDMTHLLQSLRNGPYASNVRHVALMSPRERLDLVSSIYESNEAYDVPKFRHYPWGNNVTNFYFRISLASWKVKYRTKLVGPLFNPFKKGRTYRDRGNANVSIVDVVEDFWRLMRVCPSFRSKWGI